VSDSSDTLLLGAARVTVLNAGDLVLRLRDELSVPEEEWRPAYADIFDRPLLFPSQSVLVQMGDAVVLVDAGDYAATVPPDSPYLPPDYTPPPGIPAQLASLGVAPEDVSHVVITHAHWDHFAGTTASRDGQHVPTFPNARYYLGRADWEHPDTQEGLRELESLEGRTLGVLDRAGLLELVTGDRELAAGLSLVAAPGETAGHQLLRARSGDAALYCVGDLFHHAVEAEHPEWMVTWADAATMLATRRKVITQALAERALLVAAHIRGVGRLEAASAGVRWVTA
jgi:glyoxylase-like metal-dependent hydrolase (beta-lactamase superfamily II)